MKSVVDISLECSIKDAPTARFWKLIVFQAVLDNADEILFEGQVEAVPPAPTGPAFHISFKTGSRLHRLPPPPLGLFEACVRGLAEAAGIAHATKGKVSGEIATSNPRSRWRVSSQDLNNFVRMERIRS